MVNMGKGIFIMTETTKKIIEALSQMGTEKIKAAESVEALVAELKEYGVEASWEEVQAAMQEVVQAADGRQELNEESLDRVAGGNPAAVIPLIPYAIDGVKWVIDKVKGGPKKQENKPAAPTTTAPAGPTINQTSTNNTNVVNQNNVNNTNTVNNVNFA